MGRGSYTAADWSKLKNSRNLSSAKDETEIFRRQSCDPRFDPKFIRVREARDSEDHPESMPIIIGLDVTGSMGYLAEQVAKEALNETMMKLYSTNVVKDPAILFAAYGDAFDAAPLQVTQFESDIRIAEQLLDLWLENHGNGDVALSPLWHFAAKNTALDNYEKRKKKGFLFTIGDAAECRTDVRQLCRAYETVFGEGKAQDVRVVLKEAQEKFEIFHLFLDRNGEKAQNIVNLLPGHTMVIAPSEIAAIPEILISTMQMSLGMDMEDALKQWPELKRPIVQKALKDLKLVDKKKGLVF
ncbi:MAG: hypothetical protein II139_00665 [Lachnospiraceae bacterium]|nr:hypothetical protein [Lachnospiraceae bacterium]